MRNPGSAGILPALFSRMSYTGIYNFLDNKKQEHNMMLAFIGKM